MIFSRIKLIAIIFLVLIIGTLGWLYREEIKNSAQLAQTVMQQRTTLSEMEEQMEREKERRRKAERIATQYKQQIDQIHKEARELREYIEKLEAENEDVQKWAETPMPGPIVGAITDGVHDDADNNED